MRITNLIGSLIIAIPLLTMPNPSEASSPASQVRFGVSVRIGPPVLPVYVQPICLGPGYIWQPGYWAYDDADGYYWVPGTWVLPPEVGLLWTPGYWGFSDGLYVWNAGYWGPTIGFYGGINYGFGYPGEGFFGGYWRDGQYFYNSRVTNINRTVIHNVYETNVVERNSSHVSFNGGPGGVNARPTAAEQADARQQHVQMTPAQTQHQQAARSDRGMLASVNHGRPDVAATARPGEMNNRGPASGGNRPGNAERPPANNAPGARPEARPAPDNRAPARTDRPPSHQPAPETRPPAREERPPAREAAPKSAPKPAPSHPNNPPARQPAERPAPSHPSNKRPPAHEAAPSSKPAPAPHAPNPRPSHESAPAPHASSPKPSHESAPANQQHAAPRSAPHPAPAPHESAPHSNNNNKPEKP